MSTRWYPLYQKGNPQLRVFLPNFWMKLVKPEVRLPANQVQFIVSMEMTKFDVKNYLDKMYNVPVVNVNMHIKMGPTRRHLLRHYIIKDDDFKVAYVTLPKDFKFEFPELYPEEEKKEEEEKQTKQLDEAKQAYVDNLERNKDRPGLPGWFNF